jgi:hypothetical protein
MGDKTLQKHIEEILSHPQKDWGVDILILSTSSKTLCTYWEKKLLESTGQLLKKDATVLSIYEDWEGGAGNAFGTLFAFSEANKQHELAYGSTLFQELEKGKSIAIYHTAGKGTRLAPLSIAEYNNKPGVELPAFSPNDQKPLSLLEMVIKQTAPLCNLHRGRLLVFWSDQLFIPSQSLSAPSHHVEIFAKHIDAPTQEEWERGQLHQYGIIAKNSAGKTLLVNKISYDCYQELINSNQLDPTKGLSLSLGSFSLSPSFLKRLLAEFADELAAQTGQLDADTCLWMPITLDKQVYLDLMKDKEAAKKHRSRAIHLSEPYKELLFSTQEIGQESYWWDLGNCRSYYNNVMKLLAPTAEGYHLRLLFGYLGLNGNNRFDRCTIDTSSLIVNSKLTKCRINQSLLVGVEAKNSQFTNSIVIGGYFEGKKGKETLLYHVYSPLSDLTDSLVQIIRADLYCPPNDTPKAFYTLFTYDGHQTFEEKLPLNPCSFQEQYDINQTLNLDEVKQFALEKRSKALTPYTNRNK